MTRDEMKQRDSERRNIRLYVPEFVAALLSEKAPFFRMSSGVYAIQTRRVMKDGKMIEVPTNFRRVDKPASDLSGRQFKKAKKAARRQIKNADQFKREALS